jgi:hypothetical protein
VFTEVVAWKEAASRRKGNEDSKYRPFFHEFLKPDLRTFKFTVRNYNAEKFLCCQ